MNSAPQYLVTGSAGFIGFHVAQKLLDQGCRVVGIDNFNNYYDPKLKDWRNSELEKYPHFVLCRGDIADTGFVQGVFSQYRFDTVYHLAAQAGVRYSLENPYAYIQSNIVGFTNVIESAKNMGVVNFIYASSSSVYGNQQSAPFVETMDTDMPVSLYAATKKSNESIAYSYHHLYGMHCTGLRFFTVYGPWGRPDMAVFLFTKSILEQQPVKLFNKGNLKRDFTYIDDIVDGILRAGIHAHPYAIINLGNESPVLLLDFVRTLEGVLGKEAIIELQPMQPGDVLQTHANITRARELLGWQPTTALREGLEKFVEWYTEYYS